MLKIKVWQCETNLYVAQNGIQQSLQAKET